MSSMVLVYHKCGNYEPCCRRIQSTWEMMRFAARKFGNQIGEAWQDFHATDLPLPFDERSHENQIFMPYFLFHWDPQSRRSGKGAVTKGGIVARWFTLERAGTLSALERLFLAQATMQPVTFFEVLWTDPNERIGLRDILLGTETEVFEPSASRSLRKGDVPRRSADTGWHAVHWNMAEGAGICSKRKRDRLIIRPLYQFGWLGGNLGDHFPLADLNEAARAADASRACR